MPVRKAKWNSKEQFEYSSPTLTDTEIVGVGDDAYVALKSLSNQNQDVPFTVSSDYVYNPDEIEITGGRAKLKNAGTETGFDFGTPADYTYDPSVIEVVNSKAKLKGALVPYAWWHLNELTGSVASDASGNGRNGDLINSPTWLAGKLNNCLLFNGTNQSINCGNLLNFERNKPFSFETWFNCSSTGIIMIAGKNQMPANKGFALYLSAGKLFFGLMNSSTLYIQVKTVSLFNDGNWHHLIVTYDGFSLAQGVQIYVDNILQSVVIDKNNLTDTILNSANFIIGGRSDGYYFNGKLDEIVIYERVLLPSEVSYRYNSGLGSESMIAFPTSDPDIVNNTGVPFTLLLNVFTETATKPASTSIKYQVSSDNGVTWKWWNGFAWIARTGSQTNSWYVTNESNSAAEIEAHILDLAANGTFKFKAFLHTALETQTPELDHILVGSIYYPLGNYYFEMVGDIQPTFVVQWLSTSETIPDKPSGTDVKYKYSIDSGVTYNPEFLTEPELETALNTIVCTKDGSDKLRLKFRLSTNSVKKTPLLDNVNVAWSVGFGSSGTYTSTKYIPYPSTSNGIFVGKITYEKECQTGTSIIVKAKAVDNLLEEGFIEYNSGDEINICGQFIQIEVTLTTGSTLITPKFKSCEVEFHILIGVMKTMDETVTEVKGQTTAMDTRTSQMVEQILRILKIQEGRWKMKDGELIIYAEDGITVYKKFKLLDKDQNLTMKDVVERVPE